MGFDGTRSFSNYPNGINDLISREVPLAQAMPGKVFWVGNGTVLQEGTVAGSDQPHNGTYQRPFATIDYAIGRCIADQHDIIFVKPGHSEAITAAAGIDVDVDGVTIIGLGSGDKQATVSYDNAAATFEVNADNWGVHGLRHIATVTSVATGVNVVDGADDGHISNNRFVAETLGADEFLDAISITTSDRVVVENNYCDMDEAGAQSFVHLVGAILGCTIRNNYSTGDYAVGNVEQITSASEQIVIENNTFINGAHSGLNTVANISLQAGTTGVIQNNNLYTNVTNAITGAIIAAGCFIGENSISTTAQSAPVQAESLAGGLQVTSVAAIELNDEGEASATFVVDGPVDLWGIYGVMTTAADETEEITLSTESGVTLMALGEVHTATAAGDVFFAAEPGAAPTVDEVGTAESHLWSNALRLTGSEDAVDMLAEGDVDGGGACTLYMVFAPVVAGATIATS